MCSLKYFMNLHIVLHRFSPLGLLYAVYTRSTLKDILLLKVNKKQRDLKLSKCATEAMKCSAHQYSVVWFRKANLGFSLVTLQDL